MAASAETVQLIEAADDLFTAAVTSEVLRDAERDGWAASVWRQVAEMGLPWISVPEAAGGQGGSLLDALEVLRVAGYHGTPLPLAETGVLAGWLLASADLAVPSGPATTAPCSAGELTWNGTTLSGVVTRVPWAAAAEQIVLLIPDTDGWLVTAMSPESAQVTPRRNLAGEPRETVSFDNALPIAVGAAPAGVDDATLLARGALTRVCLMAGALERVLDITVRYTAEREQFGRPIARFQAVQQHLVNIAQQSALLTMAADLAIRAADRGTGDVEITAAKTVASEATRIATRAAHQAHGAMGMTQEYALHHSTRRLWSWTREYGENRWAIDLGDQVISAGAAGLPALITR